MLFILGNTEAVKKQIAVVKLQNITPTLETNPIKGFAFATEIGSLERFEKGTLNIIHKIIENRITKAAKIYMDTMIDLLDISI